MSLQTRFSLEFCDTGLVYSSFCLASWQLSLSFTPKIGGFPETCLGHTGFTESFESIPSVSQSWSGHCYGWNQWQRILLGQLKLVGIRWDANKSRGRWLNKADFRNMYRIETLALSSSLGCCTLIAAGHGLALNRMSKSTLSVSLTQTYHMIPLIREIWTYPEALMDRNNISDGIKPPHSVFPAPTTGQAP